jgi:hypothetical protein
MGNNFTKVDIMGLSLMLTILIFLIIGIALPWIMMLLVPVIIFLSTAVIFALLVTHKTNEVEKQQQQDDLQLKGIILRHIHQWPQEVRVFARSTREFGKTYLVLQFSSGDLQWSRNTQGSSYFVAISKMNGKLINGPMPKGFYFNKRFSKQIYEKSKNHFRELFPMGLISTPIYQDVYNLV